MLNEGSEIMTIICILAFVIGLGISLAYVWYHTVKKLIKSAKNNIASEEIIYHFKSDDAPPLTEMINSCKEINVKMEI